MNTDDEQRQGHDRELDEALGQRPRHATPAELRARIACRGPRHHPSSTIHHPPSILVHGTARLRQITLLVFPADQLPWRTEGLKPLGDGSKPGGSIAVDPGRLRVYGV